MELKIEWRRSGGREHSNATKLMYIKLHWRECKRNSKKIELKIGDTMSSEK